MKIKTKELSYDEVKQLKRPPHRLPRKPGIFFRTLMRLLAASDLKQTDFSYTEKNMESVKNKPCLILMNHSSFIDLEIVSKIFYPRPYCIVCTSDGFVGKEWLMRSLGCIPTCKFVSDVSLIGDMKYALREEKVSVLMYPEASYSFDGCATPLPRNIGAFLKKLEVPVVSIITQGAFSRDPLYNCLKKRRVKVSARVECLFDEQQIRNKSTEELERDLNEKFTFDSFEWQQKNGVEINEPFRADGLERILYKCAACGTEGLMLGSGEHLTCQKCGKKYHLDVLGRLCAESGETEFPHIPDWYAYERECVCAEIESGKYFESVRVKIGMMVDFKAIYMVGEGTLAHTEDGFSLNGCDGKLSYTQKPLSSYGLYADYFWYEIGDVVCIGTKNCLYYCFPIERCAVAKMRLAAEELYKLNRPQKTRAANGLQAENPGV